MKKESTKGLMNWADQISALFDTAQKRTADMVLENMPDVEYIRIDDPLSEAVKMDETSPSVLRYMKEEAENNALKYADTLKKYAEMLTENMEYRKNASETGRA